MILDLFAGPGGWDEGLRLLGHPGLVLGFEHDAQACATRAAAGHATIRADVAAYPAERFAGLVEGLIASPPCQAFSAAGKRGGARDAAALRDHLLHCVGRWVEPTPPEGGWVDPRAALVLEPLRWAHAVRPEWIVLEQVPLVARLWSTMAVAFEGLGYRTKVVVVEAADYGVPQTRKRAICLAHRSRWPAVAGATHSEQGTPSRPRWVSMAAALGWGPGRVGFARRDDRGDSPDGYRERDLRETDQPAFTVTEKARSWTRGRVEVRRGPRPGDEPGDNLHEGFDPFEEPAQAITSRADRWQVKADDVDDRVLLNTGRDWKAGGTRADAQILDVTDSPAPALTGKSGGQWWVDRPATTIQGDPRVFVPGGHIANDGRDNSKMKGRSEDAVRITIAEALTLQTFSADYPVQGNKTKQFEQVGNAVPPLLAAHLLASFVGAQAPANHQKENPDDQAPRRDGCAVAEGDPRDGRNADRRARPDRQGPLDRRR